MVSVGTDLKPLNKHLFFHSLEDKAMLRVALFYVLVHSI